MTLDEAEELWSVLELEGHKVLGIGHCGNGYAVFLADGSYCDGEGRPEFLKVENGSRTGKS